MALRWFGDSSYVGEEDRDIERQITRESRNWGFFARSTAPAGEPVSPEAMESPPRVLLAEDDADMRALLSQALADEGLSVTECCNGIQLLDHLTGLLGRGETGLFDVIVSDIRMPGLDGLDILAGMNSDGSLPPTVLITAFGDAATHAAAYMAGAVLTLDKPFEVEDLIGVVRRILDERQGDR